MYGPNDYDDFDIEPIDEIARSEGFSIDEDGHWVPLEENNEFDDYGYDVDTDYYDADFD